MKSCIHCKGVKKSLTGATIVLCEYSGNWETPEHCFGNCEGQEYSRDYIADLLESLSDAAYDWRIDNKVVGLPYGDFEELMNVAAKMIQEGK